MLTTQDGLELGQAWLALVSDLCCAIKTQLDTAKLDEILYLALLGATAKR